jgi:hypothetical protein
VVDYSDDETDGEEDESTTSRQIRRESTAFIASIWLKMNGEDEDETKTHSPHRDTGSDVVAAKKRDSASLSTTASDAVSKKEKEIADLVAKIQEVERKRGRNPTDVQVLASTARDVVEGHHKQGTPIPATALLDDNAKASAVVVDTTVRYQRCFGQEATALALSCSYDTEALLPSRQSATTQMPSNKGDEVGKLKRVGEYNNDRAHCLPPSGTGV